MVAIASLNVPEWRCWLVVGIQNVSFTDTGLRFDERILLESIVSTLYGIGFPTKSASWLIYSSRAEKMSIIIFIFSFLKYKCANCGDSTNLWPNSWLSHAVSKRFFSNQFNLYFFEHVMYKKTPITDTIRNDIVEYSATCGNVTSSGSNEISMFLGVFWLSVEIKKNLLIQLIFI